MHVELQMDSMEPASQALNALPKVELVTKLIIILIYNRPLPLFTIRKWD